MTAISCILPTTRDRLWCLPLAIRWWRSQSHPGPCELLVISEHAEPEAFCDDLAIRFVRVPDGTSLGEKHNIGVRAARYSWIAKWDDDDWQAPRRLAESARVAKMADADLVGTDALLLRELAGDRRTYLYEPSQPYFVAGNTLLFRRSVWERTPFPDRASGEDSLFVRAAIEAGVAVKPFADPGLCVLLVHGQTTGRATWPPTDPEYRPWLGDLEAVMGKPDLAACETAFAGTAAR